MKFFAITAVLVSLPLLAACNGSAASGVAIPNDLARTSTLDYLSRGNAPLDLPKLYTPGIDPEPKIARVPIGRTLTLAEIATQAELGAELSDPNRIVFQSHRIRPRNVVAGGNGEAVGLFTGPTFSANGSAVTFGIQKSYFVFSGGNFFHTHQFVNNQCFEYGINYALQPPTLFGYNWCTGGNTEQGFINKGLVGYPGGILKDWTAGGFDWMFKWDSVNRIYMISLEEVERSDGWHLYGYDWATAQFVDIMNGYGVTGTKNACCGWSIFEVHVKPASQCNFDPLFPLGQELLYDRNIQALMGSTWKPLNAIPSGGFNFGTMIDCANISGSTSASYKSPYFSGGFVSPGATNNSGNWWLIQS